MHVRTETQPAAASQDDTIYERIAYESLPCATATALT